MSSFMRFFRGGGDEEEEQQPPQPPQQRHRQPQPQQSPHRQQQQQPGQARGGAGGPAASPPKGGGGRGGGGGRQPQQNNNKRGLQRQKPQQQPPAPSPARGGNGGGGPAGRKAAKTGDGTMSPLSATALKQLEGYSNELDGLESEVSAIEAAARDRRTPRARLLEAKDAVAQLNGSLEKLQFTGVDSVLTADLGEGKERAKEKRKSLNKRCDALRDRIVSAREALARILATS